MSIPIVLVLLSTSGWICYGTVADNRHNSYYIDNVSRVLREHHKYGGEEDQDPNDPVYQKMAKDLVYSHLRMSKNSIKRITVNKVTRALAAGYVYRLQLRVQPVDGESFSCNFKLNEQPWRNVKYVSYTCSSMFASENKVHKLNLDSRPELARNENDPKYQEVVRKALKKWFTTSEPKPFKENDVKNILVTSVKTRIVAKIILRIDFNVETVNNDNFKCNSQIVETPYDPDDPIPIVTVQCAKSNGAIKLAGLPGDETEEDPNDPEYKKLAEESFRDYLRKHLGFPYKPKDYRVTRATRQVVSGFVTRLDFKVITVEGTSFPCNSEIYDHIKKEITTTCQLPPRNSKLSSQSGSSIGGITEEDPNDPKYKKLAEESFREYLRKHLGFPYKAKDYRVTRATRQVVDGFLTRLDFKVITVEGTSFPCNSEIYDHIKKEITTTCKLPPRNSKLSSQSGSSIGGITEEDPNDPKYKKLAEESFRDYRSKRLGFPYKAKDYRVTRATRQVVNGFVTRLDFVVITVEGTSFPCKSEIYDHIKIEITTTCQLPLGKSKLSSQSGSSIGGITEEDPNDPKYKKLAEESFRDYLRKHLGFPYKAKDYRVTRATRQVVSGFVTRLDFKVITVEGTSFPCNSEIYDHIKKEITTTCQLPPGNSKLSSQSGSSFGGITEEDPNDPMYKKLAEESFRDYLRKHLGFPYKAKDYRVTRATKQVVSGFVYRLDFKVITVEGTSFPCNSKIYDHIKKEITTTCQLPPGKSKLTSQSGTPGGITEQDPNDPKYKKLAEESFREYRKKVIGLLFAVKKYRVKKVTTQVVAGTITRLDFDVIPIEGKPMSCHSKILEFDKKDITVSCKRHAGSARSSRF